jgi:hypothetical protein
MCLHFHVGAFELIGKSVVYLEKNILGPTHVTSRPAWRLALPTRLNSFCMCHSTQRQRARIHEADRTIVGRPDRHCSDPTGIVPTDVATLSSRTSLRARYFLLSLTKLSLLPSCSVAPLRSLSVVRPRRQLPSTNRVKHRPRPPQSHANPDTTPSHHNPPPLLRPPL